MDATKRNALEAAGWKIGEAADFLEMSDEERQLLDARVSLYRSRRQNRHQVGKLETRQGHAGQGHEGSHGDHGSDDVVMGGGR